MIKISVKNIQGGEIVEQEYEIEAIVNGVLSVCRGSIETKNGVNENTARIMCNEIKKKNQGVEYIRFLLEGEIIYEA